MDALRIQGLFFADLALQWQFALVAKTQEMDVAC
jgi:hypothetical protein